MRAAVNLVSAGHCAAAELSAASLTGMHERERLTALLRERWDCAIKNEGLSGKAADTCFAQVTQAYCEVWRHYHTLQHLFRMFQALDKHGTETAGSSAVIFATFFHDVVYRPAGAGNEEKSAALCGEKLSALGVRKEIIREAEALINLTKTHEPAVTDRERAFIEADLMVLASSREEYLEYARQIRKEYAFVPAARYIEGRSSVMQRFLEREELFKGGGPRADYLNERARANIRGEIEMLKKSPELLLGNAAQRAAQEWPASVTALTGTIGSGKSAVLRALRAQGAFTVSADELVADIYQPGSPLIPQISAIFGAEVVLPDGAVNRRLIASVIFSDAEKKAKLEQLVHPLVHELASARFASAIGAGISPLIYEAPILFESGLDALQFRKKVVVTAPDDRCVERICRRAGGAVSETEARDIIRAQMPAAEKAARADIVVENAGTLDELESKVRFLMRSLECAS